MKNMKNKRVRTRDKFNNLSRSRLSKLKFVFISSVLMIVLVLGLAKADIIWSGDTSTTFGIVSDRPVCFIEDDNSYWLKWDSENLIVITEQVTDNAHNCYNDNGIPNQRCCPENKGECITEVGDDFGKCAGLPHPYLCSDYTLDRYGGVENDVMNACNNAQPTTAQRSIDLMTGEDDYCGSTLSEIIGGNTCWYAISNCRCEWANSECQPAFSRTNTECSGGSGDVGSCVFSSIQALDDCENSGFKIYSWTATWSGTGIAPEECIEGDKRIRCENEVKLSFFNWINLVISLLIIFGIYLIIIKKNWRNNY